MKKTLLIISAIIFTFLSINTIMAQKKTIKVGDTIPSFTLKDQNGNNFSIDNFIGKKAMVIYFYPKDDTPGCTKEACSFRDEFEIFTDLNTLVIGISSDDVTSHKKFQEKYKLPFTLLADTEKKVRSLFGVKNFLGVIPGRVTYVANNKGKVIMVFDNMRKAEQHIDKAIQALKEN